MEPLRELGALVRRSRSDAGLSGAELARRAGVPQPSVSRVEAGRRLEDVAVVERLVSALALDAAELTLTHAADLRRYAEAFTAFQRAAVYGEDARAVISRAVADIARVAD
jgi:transcriptional regulator with XRE-family HTH domain